MKARRARGRPVEAGFTLIELIVTIAIVMVVMGALGFALSNLRRGELATTAGKLDSAVRLTYQLASIHATPFRLVIDMDENKWWAELLSLEGSACRSFAVRDVRTKDRWRERKSSRRGSFGGREKKAEEEEGGGCPDEERDADGKCPMQGFETVSGPAFGFDLLEQHSLPKGVFFDGLMTTHQQDIQKEGKGYIYFFPDGTVEKAYIYVTANDSTYTVETFPLLGKVKIHHEKLDIRGVLREDR